MEGEGPWQARGEAAAGGFCWKRFVGRSLRSGSEDLIPHQYDDDDDAAAERVCARDWDERPVMPRQHLRARDAMNGSLARGHDDDIRRGSTSICCHQVLYTRPTAPGPPNTPPLSHA
jgi:hypothetical protein